jgi:hypothetical protein
VATINTAVAARVNSHRVAFYVSANGAPDVKVDGQPIETGFAATDLGPGASLSQFQRGYELDFPDGTKLWALSLGSWGINILVLPSDALRSTGGGLIAHVPSDARFRVPALPDGSLLPPPTDRHDHYHLLYDVFSPAWRVAQDSSLFDYDEVKTTDSYAVSGFPPETSPITIDDVDPNALGPARLACAAVTDTDLADQCAFDVAITGEQQFTTLYLVSDELEMEGTSTLDEAPPVPGSSQPPVTPPASNGPLPADINFVADHLGAVGARLLAPDGTLYVNVVAQQEEFGEGKPTLLAVNPQTGEVTSHPDEPTAAGLLAWADGSLWVGEFSRTEVGKCEITRLDPATLAVQATVDTTCGEQILTVFASIGDAIWFVDPTGAAADGTGAHLRRIDPTTNAVDPSAQANLVLPFLPQNVTIPGGTMFVSTPQGLLFGERQHGLYRLLAGGDSFDSLGTPGDGRMWFPAADGFWTQTGDFGPDGTGSTASFFNGGADASLTLGFDGYLAGADGSAVYVEYQEDTEVADSLIRYAIDDGSQQAIAFGGSVPNAFGGTTSLGYSDSSINPLLHSDQLIVKVWQVPMSGPETLSQLLVQAIALP